MFQAAPVSRIYDVSLASDFFGNRKRERHIAKKRKGGGAGTRRLELLCVYSEIILFTITLARTIVTQTRRAHSALT